MRNWSGGCKCGFGWLCLALFSAVATQTEAQVEDGVYDPEMEAHYKNVPWVMQQYEQDQKQFEGDDQVMVRRGLVASRHEKTVQVYADSTGLNGGDTVEFYLVGEDSSHGYEALTISFASPGDIREALIFIGMQPGQGVDYAKLRFWPKGERVKISIGGVATNSTFDTVPLESLLWNSAEQKAILSHGFVFTGSRYVPENMDGSGTELVLAADEFDPHSIVSDYNEYASVLDIPFRASKADVYGDSTVNVKYTFKLGELIKFSMHPEFTNGVKRVLELRLSAEENAAEAGTLADLSFVLVDSESITTNCFESASALLSEFSRLIKSNKDPFVSVGFGRNLSLKSCNQFATLLNGIDTVGGIRIEPPSAGELHYRAFIPDDKLRKRENRYIQPLELHLKHLDGGLDGTLVKVNEIWGEGNKPKLKSELFSVKSYGSLEEAVNAAKVEYPVLLIFPEDEINLGQLLDYIEPIRAGHKYINIYLPQSEK